MFKKHNDEQAERLNAMKIVISTCLREKFPDIDPAELVALLAYMCGETMAHCDYRKYTSEMLIELVRINLNFGNEAAIEYAEESMGEAQGNA